MYCNTIGYWMKILMFHIALSVRLMVMHSLLLYPRITLLEMKKNKRNTAIQTRRLKASSNEPQYTKPCKILFVNNDKKKNS